jgi:hypothetical protein
MCCRTRSRRRRESTINSITPRGATVDAGMSAHPSASSAKRSIAASFSSSAPSVKVRRTNGFRSAYIAAPDKGVGVDDLGARRLCGRARAPSVVSASTPSRTATRAFEASDVGVRQRLHLLDQGRLRPDEGCGSCHTPGEPNDSFRPIGEPRQSGGVRGVRKKCKKNAHVDP